MSSGKSYKWSQSIIRLPLRYDDDSPALVVSAITNANPPVVTVSSTTSLGEADEVILAKLDSVEGMTEANETAFLMQIINGTTLRILNKDSTNWGVFTGSALIYPAEMSRWCEITGLNRQGGSKPEIDASDVCSEFEEILLGLPSFGSVSTDFKYAPLTPVQSALEEWEANGDLIAIHYALPQSGGERWVLGYVQQTGEQGANGGLWTGSMTFRATGKPVTVTPAS